MNKQIAAIVVAVSLAGGIGTGVLAYAATNDERTESPASGATNSPSTSNSPDPGTSLVLAPGSVGPVRVGFSQAEALATGLFDADVAPQVDGCPAPPLRWKDAYADDLDVMTHGNGEITSIGVRGSGVKTAAGLGVGSTYREVQAAYPEETLVDAGYSQSGLRTSDPMDGGWIGFLFDAAPSKIRDDSPVTFVEVTKGGQPDLMRDGC